jgi:hypothetical protein
VDDGAATDGTAARRDAPAACHIIYCHFKGAPRCRTLSPRRTRAFLKDISPWDVLSHIGETLQRIAREKALSGIVLIGRFIWPRRSRKFARWVHPPRPITTPFEPMEWDESNPVFEPFAQHAAGRHGVDGPPARRPALRFMARYSLHLLVALIAIMLAGIYGMSGQFGSAPLMSIAWFAQLAPLSIMLWHRRGVWLLIPGGVVWRKGRFASSRSILNRMTREDTILIISPAAWGWRVCFYTDAWQVVWRTVTLLEAEALLAAWQSPLPMPGVERLSDLA